MTTLHSAPSTGFDDVTPAGADTEFEQCRYLRVASPGNVKVTMANNDVRTIENASGIEWVSVTKIWDDGTTASGITAHY